MRAIVRAGLMITRSGVLVTDLNHTPLACNSEFGRIFAVDASTVAQMSVDELRAQVLPRLEDPGTWLRQLEEIYADPDAYYADEIDLSRPNLRVARHSTPLVDSGGQILGRLWAFDDVSRDHARAKRSAIVQRLSAFHDPEPRVVYQEVVDSISRHYNSPTILSLRQGDDMLFAAAALTPPGTEGVRSNKLKDAFCQIVMAEGTPIIVQDGRKHPTVCNILPVRLGFVRYMGVPVMDTNGDPIGTLCILDQKSDEILGPEDAEFLAIMGNRVSVELERERLFEERTQVQRAMLERQSAELAGTEAVLEAMNRGIASAESSGSEDELRLRQERSLKGLLGYGNISLHRGGACESGSIAKCWTVGEELFSLEFCEPQRKLHDEAYVKAHLSAIADQVALTQAAFRLRATLQQTQEQLLGAEKLSVVGALAATVAHDIRNIMTSIAIEAAGHGDPAATLTRVRGQVERFSVLSHRLLSYVKPRFVAREQTDLNAVIKRAAELLEPQVRAAKVELLLDLDTALPLVEADPNQVEHLFVNLLVNALQAVTRTGGRLSLKSKLGGEELTISLADNGRGMEPEVMERIFDPFYSTRPDGFGLGLFSCRRIAQEHGWHLHASSNVGEGSEFRISIPLGCHP